MQWMFGDPDKAHLDAAHLMWRVRQRIIDEELPPRWTVVEFAFPRALKGRRIWLLLDRAGSSVCERDEGFEGDLRVTADIDEFMRVWAGRSTWAIAQASGKITLDGPRTLVRAFPHWFAHSPFATRAAG